MSDRPQGDGWWLASDGRYYPPDPSAVPTPSYPDPSAVPMPDPSVPPGGWSGAPTGPSAVGVQASPGLVLTKQSSTQEGWVVLFRLMVAGLLLVAVLVGGALIAIPGPGQPDLGSDSSSYSSSSSVGYPHYFAGDGALIIFLGMIQFVVLIPLAPRIVGKRDASSTGAGHAAPA